jgi:hypothetical protein
MSEPDFSDMRKYAGTTFIKVDDLREGPREEMIAGLEMGKYGRPVLQFESGDSLSLNGTNDKILLNAYGSNGKGWIGCVVELYVGLTNFEGKPTESVLLRPVTPRKPVGERQPPEKPRSPMDDPMHF